MTLLKERNLNIFRLYKKAPTRYIGIISKSFHFSTRKTKHSLTFNWSIATP